MKHLVLGLACLPVFAACGADAGDADGSGLPQEQEAGEAVQLLHLSFDADVSDEEIEAQWQAAVENLTPPDAATNALADDEWANNCLFPSGFLCSYPAYTVGTRTGTGANDGTDGRVESRVWYEGGAYAYATIQLDNEGNDREPGDYDRYMFYFPDVPHNIRFTKARISLKGTDGWDLESFEFHTPTNIGYYNENYSGGTTCRQSTRKWLDSSTSSGWEHSTTTDCSGQLTSPDTLEL